MHSLHPCRVGEQVTHPTWLWIPAYAGMTITGGRLGAWVTVTCGRLNAGMTVTSGSLVGWVTCSPTRMLEGG